MSKHRVLLICSQDLFGASMEAVLRQDKDVELIGPWSLADSIYSRIRKADPDVVVIADKDPQEITVRLATAIIEKYPDISVICTGLAQNNFRVFSTQTLPARGLDLLEAIHTLPKQNSTPTGGNQVSPPINPDPDIEKTRRSDL